MFRSILKSALVMCVLAFSVTARGQERSTDALISRLQVKAKLYPGDYKVLAGLGAAYLQKGRETGDAADFELAKSALSKSLGILSHDPGAAFALTQMAAACMAEHRFKDAYNWAQRALAAGSGDPSPWAIAGDSLTDMGDYNSAQEAYSKLTTVFGSDDEREAIAYQRESRLSYLRFIAGDTPGAIQHTRDALRMAIELNMPPENVAWTDDQLGEEYFQAGKLELAGKAHQDALRIYPGYYRALAGLAKVRSAQGNFSVAAELYKKALAAVPYPEYAAALGDLYRLMGQPDNAQRQYDLVEFIGHLSEINAQIHNRDRALFYADHGINLDQAETLARRELEVRRDIYTWDVLAWALYKQRKYAEAYEASQASIKYGTRDALLLYHAGAIAAGVGKPFEAQKYLADALAINPHFHVMYADAARSLLSSISDEHASKASVDLHER